MIDKTDNYRVRLDIYDIPIAPVVDQYNEYIKLMQYLDLDLVGELLGWDVFVRKQDSDKIAANAKQAGIPSVGS